VSGDIKEKIADSFSNINRELSEGLFKITEKVEAQLREGRRESQSATELLEKKMVDLERSTRSELEKIRERVYEELKAIGSNVQEKLNENIKEGFKQFEKVQEHLKRAEAELAAVGEVGESINELNRLLQLPHLRGGFGEESLERLLSDFLPKDLYEMQAEIEGVGRVDAVIRLKKLLLIDSKFPREQVLPLFESQEPKKLKEARKRLSQILKTEAERIARYIKPELTMEIALMFLPSETLYFEVISNGNLWESMQKRRVFPVSPNTLAITLKGIALSYDYYEMARGVEKTISEIQKAKQHFSDFYDRFSDIGREIDKTRDAFQRANKHLLRYTGSVERLIEMR
jgi:DNA recombination protein RmuC